MGEVSSRVCKEREIDVGDMTSEEFKEFLGRGNTERCEYVAEKHGQRFTGWAESCWFHEATML